MKIISLLLAKISKLLLKMVHRGGSFPGSIILKLNPNFFSQLHINCPIIVVTGTNGKTSTSNMIANLFNNDNKLVLHNHKGDNLKEGIASLLLDHTNISYQVKADVIVLEVDELSIPHVVNKLPIHTIVITNFFRDQLDRAQEMEQVIQKIEKALSNYTNYLVLNANDPNVVRLQKSVPSANIQFYGCDQCEVSSKTTTEASEGKFCPNCANALYYEFFQYSHIGKFFCKHCDFKTPNTKLLATNIDIKKQEFTYDDTIFHAPLASLYNIYNCMSVIAIAHIFHINYDIIQKTFANIIQPKGRNEVFTKNNLFYTLNLVKNPTGTNEVLKLIEQNEDMKALMIVLNDNAQDGKDVSWIYDAQFERILKDSTNKIICSGTRCYDIALRLKYAGYSNELVIIESCEKALQTLYSYEINAYIIATYTALQPVRNLMRKDLKVCKTKEH